MFARGSFAIGGAMSRRKLSEMGVVSGAANLSEIADRLGISVATVSRGLRGISGVHPKTRERIMKIADEMGYLSKGASVESSRTILVLAQASQSSGVQDYLTGVSRWAVESNCSVLTHSLPLDRCEEILEPMRQPPALRAGKLDGILMLCKWPDDVVMELSRKAPMVSLIHQYPKVSLDLVGIDNESGMGSIVEHLVGLGHSRIGFFGVHSGVTWARSRFGGYFAALMWTGLGFEKDWVVDVSEKEALSETRIDAAPYVSKIKKLMSEGVTAIVCSGDLLCYSLLAALTKEGIRVPEDISLTGFHVQTRLAGMPKLTSVEVSSEELGMTALRRVVRRLELPDETGRTILLPCQLVVGSSTGPV